MTMQEWVESVKDRKLRMWEYKKMFTPYEIERKFMDETVFINNTCEMVKVVDAIDLKGDWMLKLLSVDSEGEDFEFYEYRRLSEIVLDEYICDQEATTND